MIKFDPDWFDPTAVPEHVRAFNDELEAAINETPDPWSLPHELVRKARREGRGPFPHDEPHPRCRTIEIDGPGGKLPLRIIPADGSSRGTFLHIHGGGWMYGDHDLQDHRMKRQADATGLDVVSVGYRLAPEHPWPAGNDDCEAAALWLGENDEGLNTDFLAIGGDSAGGHLSATTLLRLRDKNCPVRFDAAVFVAGCFDLRMTPSARQFGLRRLVLNTRDITNYCDRYIGAETSRDDPDVSPILGDLSGMPPAHFTVGTMDALLDDSLMMASRWIQFQSDTELDIYPGGCHVFQYFEHQQANESNAAMAEFLNRICDQKTG